MKLHFTKYVILILVAALFIGCEKSGHSTSPSLSITATQPRDGASNTPQSVSVLVKFTLPAGGVDNNSIQLYEHDLNGPIISTTTPSATNNNTTFTLSPKGVLKANTVYYVRLSPMIYALTNSDLHIKTTTFSFTTGEYESPTAYIPNLAFSQYSNVSQTPIFELQFSTPVTGVTTASVTLKQTTTGQSITMVEINSPIQSDTLFTFAPTVVLPAYTTYTLTLDSSITDISANHNQLALTEFTFTTGDYENPTVTLLPTFNTADTGLDPVIVLQYSTNVSGPTNISLGPYYPQLNSILCSSPSSSGTITCSTQLNLKPSTTYTLNVPDNPDAIPCEIYDLSINNNCLQPTSFSFTTGAQPSVTATIVPDWADTTQPPTIQLQFTGPAAGITGVTDAPDSVWLFNTTKTDTAHVPINIIQVGNAYTIAASLTGTSYTLGMCLSGCTIVSNDDAAIPISSWTYLDNFNPEDYERPTVIPEITPGNGYSASGTPNPTSLPPSITLIFNVDVTGVTNNSVTLHEGSPTGALVQTSTVSIAGINEGNKYTVSTTAPLNNDTYYLVVSPPIATAVGGVTIATYSPVNFNPVSWESPTVSEASKACYDFGCSSTTGICTRWYAFNFSRPVFAPTGSVQVIDCVLYQGCFSTTFDSQPTIPFLSPDTGLIVVNHPYPENDFTLNLNSAITSADNNIPIFPTSFNFNNIYCAP